MTIEQKITDFLSKTYAGDPKIHAHTLGDGKTIVYLSADAGREGDWQPYNYPIGTIKTPSVGRFGQFEEMRIEGNNLVGTLLDAKAEVVSKDRTFAIEYICKPTEEINTPITEARGFLEKHQYLTGSLKCSAIGRAAF